VIAKQAKRLQYFHHLDADRRNLFAIAAGRTFEFKIVNLHNERTLQ
jgi:hypothetical protein